jgi:predicted small integral membrane protein
MKIVLSIPGYGPIDSGPVPTTSGQKLVWVFIEILLLAAILLTVYFILKGAWDLITSEGKKEKIFNAQKTIMYAIFGLLMIACAFLFMGAIGAFVGTNLLSIPF